MFTPICLSARFRPSRAAETKPPPATLVGYRVNPNLISSNRKTDRSPDKGRKRKKKGGMKRGETALKLVFVYVPQAVSQASELGEFQIPIPIPIPNNHHDGQGPGGGGVVNNSRSNSKSNGPQGSHGGLVRQSSGIQEREGSPVRQFTSSSTQGGDTKPKSPGTSRGTLPTAQQCSQSVSQPASQPVRVALHHHHHHHHHRTSHSPSPPPSPVPLPLRLGNSLWVVVGCAHAMGWGQRGRQPDQVPGYDGTRGRVGGEEVARVYLVTFFFLLASRREVEGGRGRRALGVPDERCAAGSG